MNFICILRAEIDDFFTILMNNQSFGIVRTLLFILLLVLASPNIQAQTSLDTAVGFTVKDVNGITHRLNEYLDQNKIVVIDFFTITCGPCTTYAPLINESYYHFGCNSSNVIFLGINWGADNAGVIDFGETYGVFYPEISGTEGNGNHVVADYGILSYPTVILILPNAYIAEKYIWPPETQYLDSVIISHGGIPADCNTPISFSGQAAGNQGKILSVFPVPAKSIVYCKTTLHEPGFLEVISLEGRSEMKNISVNPGAETPIPVNNLSKGYYLLVLRNKSGTMIDRKPLIIQ